MRSGVGKGGSQPFQQVIPNIRVFANNRVGFQRLTDQTDTLKAQHAMKKK